MKVAISAVLAALSDFVARLVNVTALTEGERYPVLGAVGDQFIIEIAVGELSRRQILKTIFVSLNGDTPLRQEERAALTDAWQVEARDIVIVLPDAALFIGLLGLIQHALNKAVALLHPLDGNGNFLPHWASSVDVVKHLVLDKVSEREHGSIKAEDFCAVK